VDPDVDAVLSDETTQLPVDQIDPNPDQPRDEISAEGVAALSESIAKDGVLQPIVVRPAGKRFQIIAGERRWRASVKAGLDSIPVIVKQVSDQQAFELALIENVQREDLNPIQKAKAYKTLVDQYRYTQEQIATRVGQKRPTIANFLRLLDLPEDLQEIVSRGTITPGHARALLSLPTAADMLSLCQKIIAEDLSVRAAEFHAATLGGTRRKASRKRRKASSAQVRHLQDALSERLGTRVTIKEMKKGGQIVVHFADNDDFNRIFDLLGGMGAGS
jgi:ParB family chromosome partitioning protein